MHRISKAILLAGLGLSLTAQADGLGVSAAASTLGLGLQLGHMLNDSFGVRAGLNAFSYDQSGKESDIDYDATADLRSVGLLADWYPFSGSFRLSAGLYYNGNEINLDGKPSNNTFEFNGQVYQASDVGTLKGHAGYDRKTAPYLGMGWGSLGGKSGFSYTVDVGVLFTGKPDVKLDGTCSASVPALTCAQLQADIEAEERDLQEDFQDAEFYPVVSFSLGYTF